MDAYIGPSGVLTGTARVAQTAQERAETLGGQQEAARRERELADKRAALERQVSELRSRQDAEEAEWRRLNEQARERTLVQTDERTELARWRHADAAMAANVPAGSKPKAKL